MLKGETSCKIRRRKAKVIVINLWWCPGAPTNYGTCDNPVRTVLWNLELADPWDSDNTSYFNEVLFTQTSRKQVRAEIICIIFGGIFLQFTPAGSAIQSPFHALPEPCLTSAAQQQSPLGSHCLLKGLCVKHTALQRWWKRGSRANIVGAWC